MHLERQCQEAKSGHGKWLCPVSSFYSSCKYNRHLFGLISSGEDGSLKGLFVCSGGESGHKIQPVSSPFTNLTDLKLSSKVLFYVNKI